jgi:hypothetical protein
MDSGNGMFAQSAYWFAIGEKGPQIDDFIKLLTGYQ